MVTSSYRSQDPYMNKFSVLTFGHPVGLDTDLAWLIVLIGQTVVVLWLGTVLDSF